MQRLEDLFKAHFYRSVVEFFTLVTQLPRLRVPQSQSGTDPQIGTLSDPSLE